jgi:hypothetical protein
MVLQLPFAVVREARVSAEAYLKFLESKRVVDPMTGIADPGELPSFMKPHQRDITQWALRRGRFAVFAGTGLGKTIMELVWAHRVAQYTGKPVLIFAPLAVSAQHIREAAKFGLDAELAKAQSDISCAGVFVTNYQKMNHFDMSAFGGVVLDECFSSDTPIDVVVKGRVTTKPIDEVRPGDYILNASGVDVVSDVHRREIPYGVRVRYAGRSVVSSPNHPFFTRSGWKGAMDLCPGDEILATSEAVRMVRDRILSQDHRGLEKQILREILLSEMANASAGNCGEGSPSRGRREARREQVGMVSQRVRRRKNSDRAHQGAKSNVASGSSGEGFPHIERDEARTFRAWGQWTRDDIASVGFEGCSYRQLAGGICYLVGPTTAGISDALQTRLSERRKTARDRGGWYVSSFSKTSGPEEGRDARWFRVDGIEILEPGHPDLDRDRDADGKLYFYDIGGTRHPSFSVHGALVHNSSILKSTDGHYRNKLIEDCSSLPFRLAATATPAPNDFMELGNHAEFLGVMKYTDMLATFFSHDGGETQKWRLKGHAETEFWKWMASWSVMLRKPSDIGYRDEGYDLPPLNQMQHVVGVPYEPSMETGLLFPVEANGLSERLGARRDSIAERVAMAASLTPDDRPFVWWCNLNSESEALVRAIPGAIEVRGSDQDEAKERKLVDFSEGRIRILVTKPSISGWGMNWQHCADTGFVGLSDSFEAVFQAVRRFWRFGQTKPVNVHFIAAETEGAVVANLRRKELDADRMAAAMVAQMADISAKTIRGAVRDRPDYDPQQPMLIPNWLESAG